MKKKLALILALVMIAMTLIACGGSGGSDTIVGSWTIDAIEANGINISFDDYVKQAEAAGMGEIAALTNIEMTFSEDGAMTMTAAGQEATGTWTGSGSSYTLTVDGDSMDVTLKDGKIVMEEDGQKVTLKKK